MPDAHEAVRTVRILHLCFLVPIPLYAALAEWLGPADATTTPVLMYVLIVCSVAHLGGAFILYLRNVKPAEDILARQPADADAMSRWRSGHILSFALCESVAFFGVVVRVLGGNFYSALPFFAAAFMVMVLMTPRPQFHR
jgi:hypothetical protein